MGDAGRFVARVEKTKRGSRRPAGGTTDGLVGAVADAWNRGKVKNWEGADAATWVGLHVLCYRVVYDGRTPDELVGATKLRRAVGRVARFVSNQQALQDPGNVANMIKEFWSDHEGKLAWGKEKGVNIKPPSIWAVFTKRTLHGWVERHGG